jgi:hypothetical protein
VRLSDEAGNPLANTGCLFTAGPLASPDQMPQGFMLDRQTNSRQRSTISLYLDFSVLAGDARVPDPRNTRKTLRPAIASHRPYGAIVEPADLAGLVHHALARNKPDEDLFAMLGPHQTTVLDVILPRKVHEGVFRLTRNLAPKDFSKPVSGPAIPG